jgi:alkyldihydroxyacetonephosphate synthase
MLARLADARRRKHWGWGFEDDQPTLDELNAAAAGLAAHLGFGHDRVEEAVPLSAVKLAPPRVPIPGELAPIATDAIYDRALHACGRSYLDVVRGLRGEFPWAPDFVVHARDEADVVATLRWAAGAGVAVSPVGGGTSVVGGIDARPGPRHAGAIALSLRGLHRVLEVDEASRTARIQAGATGPELEAQLAEQGYTLRFYPQSFELATFGGWVATRAGGHFATGPTHIDDLVQSIRAVTPAGEVWESRRLPGSGAGPSPDRLLLGSEGTLGVITEAWVRVLRKPVHRRSASVSVSDFRAGCALVREIVQAGLWPSNCRLIDAREAKLTFAGDGSSALLVLAFESAEVPVDARMEAALEICRRHGATWEEKGGGDADSAGAWRNAFLRAPYLRDTLIAMGVVSETFETAMTWDRMDDYVERVMAAAEASLVEQCSAGQVSGRLTHAYPDGAAPYFTCVAPAERGREAEQWTAVKRAASDAIEAAGGTITHHHAVGRDHRPWYDRQRPEPFAAALRAAKAAVDPAGILNPGVLLEP